MRKLWFIPILLAALFIGGCASPVDEDVVLPTVLSTSPVDNAVNVSKSGNVTATFSEEMDTATIVAANFTLKQGSTSVPGAVSYAGDVATFNPTSDLAYNTLYTATVGIGVKDVAGNALATSKVWTFRTLTAPDTAAPTVSSTSPAALATDVAVGGNVTATFSEAMASATIIAANFSLKQGSTSVPGAVSYAGNVATFNPTSDLAYNTLYTATVDTGVEDMAGNALASNKVWTFTTLAAPDTAAPTVSSTSPAALATDVAVGGNVTATFSEAMASGTIIAANFTLMQASTPIAGSVSYAGNVATFNPTSNLAYSTVYTATVATEVTDLAGNHLAVDKVWTFTTLTTPDTLAPTVSSTSPAALATDVAIGGNVTATFSEAMASGTIIAANFTLMQSSTPIAGSVSYAGNVATFNPTSNLAYSTVYTATVDTGVEDEAGNALAADKVWTFTTEAAPDITAPTVSSTSPAASATDVVIGANITATFSEAMASATIIAANFTLAQAATPIAGAVSYVGNVATFNPTSNLANNTVYTATVTTDVTDLAGNHLAADKVWTFTTEAALPLGPSAVLLGSAENYVILAKAAISATVGTAIVGDLGVSPAAQSFITGFGLVNDATNEFATSSLVTGRVYASDNAPPTPTILTTAVSDMETAYTDAAGRVTPDFTNLGAGDVTGLTLVPGLYTWGTSLQATSGFTITGAADDVWIFQIAQDLTIGNGVMVTLGGSAQAKNIFWQVAGQTSLGTTSNFKGIILCMTQIVVQTGATVNGRLLAQTQVTLDANAVTEPSL